MFNNKGIGLTVSQEKKDQINRQIANKEIRILDINIVLNQAAALKKERDDNGRGEVP